MESPTSNNSINAIKDVKKLFNELRSNLSGEETNRIREKLYKKEAVYNFLKEKEQEVSLTNKKKTVLKNVERYLKNIGTHLKNFQEYLKKLEKYQYGLNYLFNEHNEEDYITEPLTSNKSINARKLFNEHRSNLSREETKRIRKELYKKEAVYNVLKEKGGLTDKQKKVLKNIGRYLKKLNNDLKKLNKYHDNVMYGLDYLFNELNEEDYYKPTEVKSAFDGGYVLYESRGDKDSKLAIYEYFDIIRPYLRDMIHNQARGEWKIQRTMQIIFVSFIDANKTRVMHTKSDNTKWHRN